MKKFISGASLALLFTTAAFSQTASTGGSASTDTSTKVTKGDKSIDLSSAATITGKLQGSLNAEKAKVGDEVIIKTTQAVKENGKTLIEKGSQLIGRVSEVKQKTKDRAGSEIGVIFDRLKSGSNEVPVTVTIFSVTRVDSGSVAVDDTFAMATSSPSTVGTSTQSTSNRGLLGNATSTATGVLNTPRNVAGTVLDTSGARTAGALDRVETNIRGLQIDQTTNVSANGATTLGMNTGNLKLDSGTVFTVKVSSAVSN